MGKESGSLPMVGGYGEHSYLRNSSYQRKMFESVQEIIKGAVLSKLDLSTATTAGPIRIADLGCSVGPNTFYAVQAVVDAVTEAISQRSPGPDPDQNQQAPEFQVFFNDQVGNDFNVLLSTLPEDRRYFAAAVPGSFHSRLFPRDSVHFFNSSGSLHWLSKAPEGAPNKGRVHLYGGAPAVKKAYLAQFMADMDVFLKARAEELVAGGLLAVLIGCHEPPAANCTLEDPFGSIYNPIFRELLAQVMLAILISMLTILTWHFTSMYTTKSINSLAYGLRFELLQRPILRMWNILNSTVEITMAQVKLSEYVIGRYTKSVTHAAQSEMYEVMKDVTWALFSSRIALNAITINYRNGFVQAFHRDHKNNSTFYIYSDSAESQPVSGSYKGTATAPHNGDNIPSNASMSSTWYGVPLDPVTGEKIGLKRKIPPEDLIKIAGISELQDGAASWHVAVSKFTDSPLLSAALPVHHPVDGSIMAVVGVTTALYSVGQLMRELVEFHSGYMYLTSREGFLLATSTDAPLLRNTPVGPKLMLAIDSEDPIISSGAEWLENTYRDKVLLKNEVHAENVMLNHQKYYVDSFFLNLKRLPLVGVIIIPRKYILGKVDQRALAMLVILVSASICILAVGCVCILILTSGVSKEMNLRAELISHLEARRRAEASNNYKSQFLANMSHELRTPMAAVIGLLDILISDDCLTNEQFSTVSTIRKCSTALLRLLNNILDLSKVEAGKLILEDAEFDLAHELEGLIDMFSAQCTDEDVELVLDLSDDMPKLVRGDSARVVQIFANLISNSIKFTSSGYIVVRGWCESCNAFSNMDNSFLHKGACTRTEVMQNTRLTIWFEVEDTGCGIDPSKWESVFESFEQADPSTTRMYGGTGLGLCIVRTLVRKMGGEINVVKKKGPGTLMQFYIVLNTSTHSVGDTCLMKPQNRSMMVLLALKDSMVTSVMSQWLTGHELHTYEASDWSRLTEILQIFYQDSDEALKRYTRMNDKHNQRCFSMKEYLQCKDSTTSIMNTLPWNQGLETTSMLNLLVVVDTGLLDLCSDQWKLQLDFLERYGLQANSAWVINHNTPNVVKMELRRKGYLIMVNKPLYKSKLIQILETANGDSQECFEMGPFSDLTCSDDLDTSNEEKDATQNSHPSDNCSAEVSPTCAKQLDKMLQKPTKLMNLNQPREASQSYICLGSYRSGNVENLGDNYVHPNSTEDGNSGSVQKSTYHQKKCRSSITNDRNDLLTLDDNDKRVATCTSNIGIFMKPEKEELFESDSRSIDFRKREQGEPKKGNLTPMDGFNQKTLQGLHVLLAEDTTVLQRVATIMLEKLGAKVLAVGDGKQAVQALQDILNTKRYKGCNTSKNTTENAPEMQNQNIEPFDLILMDCQMPRMDGYEATKAIRSMEVGVGKHIPIVSLTAHAMSSDEAKCLEVGMDAYLTKPIDSKLMVSTILSLTKKHTNGQVNPSSLLPPGLLG